MKKKKERIAIFIDGSNFYFKTKKDLKLKNTTYFQYRNFCEWLVSKRDIVSVTYYVGKVKAKVDDTKGQKLRQGQQKLFSHLHSEGIAIVTGFMMKNANVYHEKGVDVKIAVDLLVGAYDDSYDTAVLISSDTDLIPAIRKVATLGKKVEYIGFSHAPSLGLQKHVSSSRLLIKEELEKFTSDSKNN